MSLKAYIERQKSIIRSRHDGEEYLIDKGETFRLDGSERILKELAGMKGLNTFERTGVKRGYEYYY